MCVSILVGSNEGLFGTINSSVEFTRRAVGLFCVFVRLLGVYARR